MYVGFSLFCTSAFDLFNPLNILLNILHEPPESEIDNTENCYDQRHQKHIHLFQRLNNDAGENRTGNVNNPSYKEIFGPNF